MSNPTSSPAEMAETLRLSAKKAIAAQLPEDEPDTIPDWCYDTIIADALTRRDGSHHDAPSVVSEGRQEEKAGVSVLVPASIAPHAEPTPGPWEICGNDDLHIRAGGLCVTLITGGMDDVMQYGLIGPTSRANARLIAAAPDYHEATERIRQDCAAVEGEKYVYVERSCFDALMTAHAKAEKGSADV